MLPLSNRHPRHFCRNTYRQENKRADGNLYKRGQKDGQKAWRDSRFVGYFQETLCIAKDQAGSSGWELSLKFPEPTEVEKEKLEIELTNET